MLEFLFTLSMLWFLWVALFHYGIIDPQNKNWYDVHHYYLGMLMVAFGATNLLFPILFLILGSVICADDLFQHWKNANGEPSYRSPLHQLYGMYAYPYVRRFMYAIGLGEFFDGI